MAVPIIPRVICGRLYFQTADVLFPTFAQAASATAGAEAHRLDIAEPTRFDDLEQELQQRKPTTGQGGAS